MIRISHEMPLDLLSKGFDYRYNDYSYALIHLFENKQYYDYYVKALRDGRQVYLDNSVFETEREFDSDDFVSWLKKLVKDSGSYNIVYIIPDTLDESMTTITTARNFLKKYPDLPGKSMCVMQGTDFEELLYCYDTFESLGIDQVGISFNCKAYGKSNNQLQLWKQKRQQFIKYLTTVRQVKPNYLHLLGCALPDEFKFYVDEKLDKYIVSLDTSNPVVHGLLGIKYQEDYGLKTKKPIKLCTMLNYLATDSQEENIIHNILEFRRINNLCG